MNVIGPKPAATRVPEPGAPRPAATPAPADAPPEQSAARPPVGEASLWDLLTPEERDFFAQQTALGPLTYRPDGGTRGGTPPPTGRRIDVRG